MNCNEEKTAIKKLQIERLLSSAFPVAQIGKDVLGLRQDGTEPNAPLLNVENDETVGQFQLQFSSSLALRPSCL